MQIRTARPGDIIEVDYRGGTFLATFREVTSAGEVKFTPHASAIGRFTCTPRQVTGLWKANTATRRAKGYM